MVVVDVNNYLEGPVLLLVFVITFRVVSLLLIFKSF